MHSQVDIRYSVSPLISDVSKLTNAFPGNLTLCLETMMLYQYVEYSDTETIPVPDNNLVIQTNDVTLKSRWVSISAYTAKSFSGAITNSSWVLDSTNNVYRMEITLTNTISGFFIKFLDTNKNEIWVEEVTQQVVNDKITKVICTVGAVPDCRFEGEYLISYSKLA